MEFVAKAIFLMRSGLYFFFYWFFAAVKIFLRIIIGPSPIVVTIKEEKYLKIWGRWYYATTQKKMSWVVREYWEDSYYYFPDDSHGYGWVALGHPTLDRMPREGMVWRINFPFRHQKV